ncbi:hypothetical protein DEIPH_ctg009orf0006 [Deinococcus phoenicis]|uniref:Uncharacterized protein n=1 Tax=Deinococcus phoenicis TaxID=1476583 RepID=A0A016QT71_9DEIO|nr:hypothetical protein [Deinococcus phoenicis]EYB69268.1 hypothetical protein DEIPH_ctg009orf0006 [Deinococcus phoenicis]
MTSLEYGAVYRVPTNNHYRAAAVFRDGCIISVITDSAGPMLDKQN